MRPDARSFRATKTSGSPFQPSGLAEEKKEGVFSGRTVVITGTLSSYKRSAAQEEIRKRGGNVADSVSKQVDLVVVGEDAGSKLEKAKKLGIEIIDEARFLELLKA